MLAPTSPLAPLLLIVKAGMSAVSFYARNVIRSLLGFLFCSLTLWLILVLWLIFVFLSSLSAGFVVVFFGDMILCCALLVCTLFFGSFYFLSPNSTHRMNPMAVILSIGAFLGCCFNVPSNCLDASRILLTGVSSGIVMAWCLNLTVSEISSAPVYCRMPLNVC